MLAGACAACGANIVDAQIFTTTDGRALDTVVISRAFDADEDEARRGKRIASIIEQTLEGRIDIDQALAGKRQKSSPEQPSRSSRRWTLDNELSDRFTVIEVECLDRHGLLYDLTHTISELSLDIASAHIATFGERVVDTFYVTDLVGHKIGEGPPEPDRKELLEAIGQTTSELAVSEVTIS